MVVEVELGTGSRGSQGMKRGMSSSMFKRSPEYLQPIRLNHHYLSRKDQKPEPGAVLLSFVSLLGLLWLPWPLQYHLNILKCLAIDCNLFKDFGVFPVNAVNAVNAGLVQNSWPP